jgi:hypothetical protein
MELAAMSENLSSTDKKDLILAWFRLSPKKMFIVCACILVGYLMIILKDDIKEFVHSMVVNYETKSTYGADGLPTTISKTDQENIKSTFKDYLTSYSDFLGALVMYEYVPKGNSILYQGRVAVVGASANQKDVIDRYGISWLPMNAGPHMNEKILRGETFTLPSTFKNSLLDPANENIKLNVRLVNLDGFKMLVCIPIIDGSDQVRGYIEAFLNRTPTSDNDLKEITDKLNKIAIESSEHFN